MTHLRGVISIVIATLSLSTHAEELTQEETEFFEKKIRPVLVKECYGCHSAKAGDVRGGLRLDTRELTRLGGSSGPAVVPGSPDESVLYAAMTHEGFEMPPERKLPQNVIDDFRTWIEMGAPDPRLTKIAQARSTISDEEIASARAGFWAYQTPVDHQPPGVDDSSWPVTEIDRFVLEGLENSGIKPAADAESHQVLRRLCFDLVGLPPSPEQISFFSRLWKRDPQGAVDHVIDSLLEQEQFGERWGRHWLDVARYAESTGREVNMTYPHAWRYRDYVIDSFNVDKPFDQFVREQIAGDLMPAKTDEDWTQHLVATTFLAIGPKNVNERNRLQFDADLADEQVDATTRVFLGMSVACARCHDHKFDAIRQSDYYAMAGIFRNSKTYFGNPPSEFGPYRVPQIRRQSSLLLLPTDDPNPYDKSYTPRELQELVSEARTLRQEAMKDRPGAQGARDRDAQRRRIRRTNQISQLSAKLAVVDENGRPRSYCMGVQDRDEIEDVRLLVRGEIDQPGPVIPRGFPKVISDQAPRIGSTSSGRLELAYWIGSDENPLTARVMVNRIWKHLLGQGIVTSTENFGVTGQAPSHPELLDYLAVRFVDSGWSMKALIREIARSRVYRISTEFDAASHQLDPDNALLWRANRRRLDAESLRDAMLAMSGEVDLARPRGSEVAKAGYTRVRDGFLGDPRNTIRKAVESAGRQLAMQTRSRGSNVPRANVPPGRRPGNWRQKRARGLAPGRYTPTATSRREMVRQRQQAMESVRAEAVRKATNQLDMEDAKFRSVYLPIVRDQEPRSLDVFDFADSNTVTGVREFSNTSNQALYMLNNRFVIQQSEALAQRIADEVSTADEQIQRAFLITLGRIPTRGERTASAAFMRRFGSQSTRQETLGAFCQSLFAAAEFRYLD